MITADNLINNLSLKYLNISDIYDMEDTYVLFDSSVDDENVDIVLVPTVFMRFSYDLRSKIKAEANEKNMSAIALTSLILLSLSPNYYCIYIKGHLKKYFLVNMDIRKTSTKYDADKLVKLLRKHPDYFLASLPGISVEELLSCDYTVITYDEVVQAMQTA